MERETGIEPATNSLEGCDSTTELLPQLQGAGSKGTGSREFLIYCLLPYSLLP